MSGLLSDFIKNTYGVKPNSALAAALAEGPPSYSGPDAQTRDLTPQEWTRVYDGAADVAKGVGLGLLGTVAGPAASGLARFSPYRGFMNGGFFPAGLAATTDYMSQHGTEPSSLRAAGRAWTDVMSFGTGTDLYNKLFGTPDVDDYAKQFGLEPPAMTQAALTRAALTSHPTTAAERSDAKALPLWLRQLHSRRDM